MGVDLRRDVVICIDMDCCTGFMRLDGGSCGWRSSTSDVDGSDSLCNIHHLSDLTLSVLEIVDGDDRVLTLVVVVGKRIVWLVVRMSNGASAEED